MFDLSTLQSLYEQQGPFATVYLEGRSPSEDAAKQVRLRWENLRERLHQEGAPDEALDAIENELGEGEAGEVQTNGRVLVASAAGLHLQASWDAALGAGDTAVWADLPDLGGYVREQARAIRVLVSIVDQQSAVIRGELVAQQHTLTPQRTTQVQGDEPRRRSEEIVHDNAREIVEQMRSVAKKLRPHVVVLTGETQGRSTVADELPPGLAAITTQIERGGTNDERAEELLADELREIAAGQSQRHMEDYAEQYHKAHASDLAVTGAQRVLEAASMGAVETLLLTPTPAEREAELVHACVQQSASAALVSDAIDLSDHVGAVLRFPITETANDVV